MEAVSGEPAEARRLLGRIVSPFVFAILPSRPAHVTATRASSSVFASIPPIDPRVPRLVGEDERAVTRKFRAVSSHLRAISFSRVLVPDTQFRGAHPETGPHSLSFNPLARVIAGAARRGAVRARDCS